MNEIAMTTSSLFAGSSALLNATGLAAPEAEVPTGASLYMRYALGGALCCSITHSLVVPVDVVKTRLQTNPGYYKGMLDGFARIPREEGAGMLLQGLGPTAVGYFMQGAFKFGFYEYFKKTFSGFFDPETAQNARTGIFLAAGGCAEVIADLALCPMEATRIRLVSQPEFATGLPDAASRILSEEGLLGFYKGLGPILLKQVPYTMCKFAVFERAVEGIYATIPYKKEELSNSGQVAVSLSGGIFSGVCAAIVSQPADTILSKINQVKTSGSTFEAITMICRKLGFGGLFLGLGARCLMVGSLTAGQFAIYDSIKIMFGIPTTGGAAAKK